VSDRSRLIAFSDCRAIIAPTLVLMLLNDIDGPVPGSAASRGRVLHLETT
jgi:hypothetical protein